MDEQNMNMQGGQGGSKGSLIGIIVIIIIVILGGWYFWSQRAETVDTPDQAAGTFESGSEDADMMDTDLDMEVEAEVNAS